MICKYPEKHIEELISDEQTAADLEERQSQSKIDRRTAANLQMHWSSRNKWTHKRKLCISKFNSKKYEHSTS